MYRRHVKEALSYGGTKDVYIDYAVEWSRRIVLGVASKESSDTIIARLYRVEGDMIFYVFSGPCDSRATRF